MGGSIPDLAGLGITNAEPMQGDVSTRQYWRSPQGIVMLDIADGGDARRAKFIDISARLLAAGLRAPKILANHQEAGILLIEDLGSQDLLQVPTEANYTRALERMLALRNVDAEGLTHYSAKILSEELGRFCRFFLPSIGNDDDEILSIAAPILAEIGEAAAHFVHVDYHAENLLVLDDDIGIIDFQDARFGHPLYDLLSLVDDVRYALPPAMAENLKQTGFEAIGFRDAEFWFDALSAQRLFKIIGIFARQIEQGREKYRPLMARCFVLLEARLAHPELRLWREWYGDLAGAKAEEFKREATNG